MSTPFFTKAFWKVRNTLEAAALRAMNMNYGVLTHKIDLRDRVGVDNLNVLDRLPVLANRDIPVFSQNPFNICVFASRAYGYSVQEGIEFSVRWDVKNGKRRGYISGNGFSSLRSENKLGTEVGRLPIEYMPHETNGYSWQEYSAWETGDDALLQVSDDFMSSQYRAITNVDQAMQALRAGYVLFTANKWWSAMNRPQDYNFFLVPKGYNLGGHAFSVVDYEPVKKAFVTKQTFGENYGDKGKAYLENLFSGNMYAVYIEEHLPFEVKYNYFLKKYNGKAVKAPGNPSVYEIVDGYKRGITSMEEFTNSFNKCYTITKEYLDRVPNL